MRPYRGDADDVTQNVCLVVLRTVGQLRDPTRIRSWLAAVTLNEVRSFYRRQSREAERIRRAAGARPVDGAAAERTSVIGGLRVDLLDGLESLPRHHAFALGLRQLGVGYEEITAELSRPDRLRTLFDDRTQPVPIGSVKRWVSEARVRLTASLAATEPGPVEGR
jgi:DNA-directed RNA polymerase specialized sigma24 family protein